MIFISDFLENGLVFTPGITGHNTVDKRGCKDAGFFQPLFETLTQFPFFSQFTHAAVEFDAIVIDELDRQNNQALVRSIVKMLSTFKQELGQLAGICVRRAQLKLIIAIKDDAGFSCIADDKAKRVKLGVISIFFIFIVSIDCVSHGGDNAGAFYRLSVDKAAQHDCIALILFLKRREEMSNVNGLDQNHRAVEICFLIADIDHIIDKCAKKIAFAKLKDFNWT